MFKRCRIERIFPKSTSSLCLCYANYTRASGRTQSLDQEETKPPWWAKHALFRFNTIIFLWYVKSMCHACSLDSVKSTSQQYLKRQFHVSSLHFAVCVDAFKLKFYMNYHKVRSGPLKHLTQSNICCFTNHPFNCKTYKRTKGRIYPSVKVASKVNLAARLDC